VMNVLDTNDMKGLYLVMDKRSKKYSSQGTWISRGPRIQASVPSTMCALFKSHWRTLVKGEGWC
jgi:hypothetical protein